ACRKGDCGGGEGRGGATCDLGVVSMGRRVLDWCRIVGHTVVSCWRHCLRRRFVRQFLTRILEDLLDLGMKALCCALFVDPPIGRPSPNERPPEAFEDGCANLVPIACGRGAVVCSPVALDTDEISSRPIWVDDAKIDAESRHSDLRNDAPALLL